MTSKSAGGVRVIDADTYMTERYDLFTSRAPGGYAGLVPYVVQVGGRPHRIVGEKNCAMGPARAVGLGSRSGGTLHWRGMRTALVLEV